MTKLFQEGQGGFALAQINHSLSKKREIAFKGALKAVEVADVNRERLKPRKFSWEDGQ